jgi:thermitase
MKGIVIALVAVLLAASASLSVPQITMAGDTVGEPVASLASASPFYDPYIDNQWALKQMPLLPFAPENDGILIAVLDTGIDVNHEDLAGKVTESINFSSSKTATDINGHGTHIAGIIAASANNGIGITGAAPGAKLLNVKIAEDNGTVWASNIAKGIIWSTDRGAKIINMSLAVPSKYQPLEEAIQYAWSHGVVMVAAAGNYVQAITYPAAYSEVIAVAATTTDGKMWSESNDGDFIDAYAPGVLILSTLPDNKYGVLTGSSMASAYVTSIIANAIPKSADSNNNGRVNDEIANLIRTLLIKPGTGSGF